MSTQAPAVLSSFSARGPAVQLCTEDQAAAGRGGDDTVGHLGTRLQHKVQTAAMHWDDHVGLKLLDLGNHLLEVVGGRRAKMEPTDDRVHFLYTGDLLRLPDGI